MQNNSLLISPCFQQIIRKRKLKSFTKSYKPSKFKHNLVFFMTNFKQSIPIINLILFQNSHALPSFHQNSIAITFLNFFNALNLIKLKKKLHVSADNEDLKLLKKHITFCNLEKDKPNLLLINFQSSSLFLPFLKFSSLFTFFYCDPLSTLASSVIFYFQSLNQPIS